MRTPAGRPSPIALALAILAALVIMACVADPLPAPSASANQGPTDPPLEPSLAEEPSLRAVWLDVPVTVESRDLLEVIEPGEQITVDVFLEQPADLAAAATAVGLAAETSPPDAV